jgi:hypothetical protein
MNAPGDIVMLEGYTRLLPMTLFGVCFLIFADVISEAIEFRFSPAVIRFAGAFLLALAMGLFAYLYLHS